MLAKILIPTVSFFLGIGGLALWQRITHTNKPKFSRESGRDARSAINVAKAVFNQSAQMGGHLTHPWLVDGKYWYEGTLQEEIEASRAEIGDGKLSSALDEIANEVTQIFAATHQPLSESASRIDPEPFSVRQQREIYDKIDERQRLASDQGLSAVAQALARLNEISRNS
jgi:hypothetical protein